MLTEAISNKITELFESTPPEVGVGYGFKIVDGEYTSEKSIVFHVKEKLPLDQVPEGQLLPSTVEIEGVVYKTDVVEVGEIKALATCPTSVSNGCYGWQNANTPPANRNTTRPLKGGLSITSGLTQGFVGTLGLIAVDTNTQALVGLSNNHVIVPNAFYTSEQNIYGALQNELANPVYQAGEGSNQPSPESLLIGRVIKYSPFILSGYNYLDAAVCSIEKPSTISNTESFKQFGLNYNTPMPFATTGEINTLLSTDPELYSSGRTSGVKGPGPCRLKTFAVGTQVTVSGYEYQGGYPINLNFNDIIAFSRYNINCTYPIAPGDSGSALIADFNGVWKILGLCFAGSEYVGYACRIDRLAAALGIEAWDGTAKNYIDPTSVEYKTVTGGSSAINIECGGEKYWQIGFTNVINNPC
jgi:hypothetical protein